MTRSNLHITLSSGQEIFCVSESTSAPEQGYIVEELITPLLALNDSNKETALLTKHCTMYERRANATYRYYINLITKKVTMFEENFYYNKDIFFKGEDLTHRYTGYLQTINREDNYGNS
ncbi:penicillin-binding protein [Sphingobacterium siyangense]|uniref:penicillin-binding protein n=1 Tax=Sphingobacterium siyangense TaxID=459529 RepID=UPI002FDDDB30